LPRFKQRAELGLDWVRCGWRLFRRNPWLLGGMGFYGTALVILLAFIPFIGGPLIGLLAPALLAGIFTSLDGTAKQKLRLPPALRMTALKHSPRALLSVLRDESRLMQTLILGLCCMAVVVLGDIVAWLIAGNAWANRGAGFPLAALPRLVAAVLTALSIYAAMAALLVYALPLALLDKEPLVPAVRRSFKTAAEYPSALAVLFAFLLLPFGLAAVTSLYSIWLAYLVGVAGGALMLPVAAAGLYCSYRTLFSAAQAPRAAEMNGRRAAGFIGRS